MQLFHELKENAKRRKMVGTVRTTRFFAPVYLSASLANILSSGPNICITMTQTNGQLFLCDQRVSNDWKSISSHNSSQGELWTFDHKDNDVIKLSANGSLMKYDVRNNKEILLQKLNKTPEEYANVKVNFIPS